MFATRLNHGLKARNCKFDFTASFKWKVEAENWLFRERFRGQLLSARDQCSFSLGEGRFADLRLFVFLHKNGESAICAGQHLRTFMCVCICSLLGGDRASTNRGGAELRPAEERWVAEEENVLPEQPAIPFKV